MKKDLKKTAQKVMKLHSRMEELNFVVQAALTADRSVLNASAMMNDAVDKHANAQVDPNASGNISPELSAEGSAVSPKNKKKVISFVCVSSFFDYPAGRLFCSLLHLCLE